MNKKVVAAGLVVVALLIVLLAWPVTQRCGNPRYSCATAPDAQGFVHYYYEVQPLGVVIVNTVVGSDIRIHYSSGDQLEKR